MAPAYLKELRYSHLVASWQPLVAGDYEAQSPLASFEKTVHQMFITGQRHLHHDEFGLALDTFNELQAMLLKTVHPKLPIDPYRVPGFKFPKDVGIITSLTTKAADILKLTPVTAHKLPSGVLSLKSTLPAAAQEKLKPATESDIFYSSFHGGVFDAVEKGFSAANTEDFKTAARHYAEALGQVPADEKEIRASLLHDIAILDEKLNQRPQAEANAQESAKLFGEARHPKGQAIALDTLTGVLTRSGKADQAAQIAKQADEVRKKNNLFPITVTIPDRIQPVVLEPLRPVVRTPITRFTAAATTPALSVLRGTRLDVEAVSTSAVPALMSLEFLDEKKAAKTLTIRGGDTDAAIALDAAAVTNITTFLKTLSETDSVDLLTGFSRTPVQMVAYLPHMYFYVVPMAIADCLEGLGNLAEAEEELTRILSYQFINKNTEIVQWWTRLAELYLLMGDEKYRHAKDDPAKWAEARVFYEHIVKANGTITANSPLYKDAKLAGIKARVTEFLAGTATALNDNPKILLAVRRARAKIDQIQAGLNYFGFAPDYAAPFSFEYLQNTARYFAQNASQIEQQYIQYKSTAENEEFRREQLDQQAEVARQSVILEQRGVAEAAAGIAVAQASLNYAEVQRVNAVKSKQDFDNVRWELLELAEAEAWASAASVDSDDEIKQTWNGNYYSSNKRRRSKVLQDLAYRRTRISHDLEGKKLQREIDSANAYKGIAQAQVNQAQKRKAVAEQRVEIARLQQRQAEENRDFMDMKEFGARLWYELAREARRLSRRYLDMAIETAMLMERAYNAETERGLSIIRFDYGKAATSDLLAADRLRADIDYFTLDHITTIKPKKSPVKKTISVADAFPMSFQQLKTTGQCFFQTEMAQFDREHPGLYLCKLRNVELLFVGITGATSIGGTLRNVGVSRFRLGDGTIVARNYSSDVMPLSQYDLRQDALAYRFSPNDLRPFENNGIDTAWQLELPRGANDFDFDTILDVVLVLYYDGLFSPTLEAAVKSALPATGSASRAFSMALLFPDELFYLKSNGDAEIVFDASMFPHTQTDMTRTNVVLKVAGDPAKAGGLTMRLLSAGFGTELTFKTDAGGEVNDSTAGKPLRKLRNLGVADKWTLKITKADNPGLVQNDTLDLSWLQDILIFMEYSFKYR
jgi:hypothetical protein